MRIVVSVIRSRRTWIGTGLALGIAMLVGGFLLLHDGALARPHGGSAPAGTAAAPDFADAGLPGAATSGRVSTVVLPDPRPREPDAVETAEPVGKGLASVHGRVLDGGDAGVPGVGVQLHRGAVVQRAVSDARGAFAFEGLARGVHGLLVDPASLPPGWLPPWKQHLPREYDGHATGVFGTVFRVDDDGDHEIDLRVFLGGTVSGRLVDSQGRPLAGELIELRSGGDLKHAGRTLETGAFRIERVYPGSWTALARLSTTMKNADSSAPLPRHFELRPGQQHALPDLVADAGGHVLTGRVLDRSDGAPVAGLRITCREAPDERHASHWETRTDEAGRFRLGRVPSSALLLAIEPDEAGVPPGGERLARPVEPRRVFTQGAPPELDVGTIEVEDRRPFAVRGSVRIDPDWADEHDLRAANVSIAARVLGEVAWSPVAARESDRSEERNGGGHERASFSWACATPHAAIEFRIRLESDGVDVVERLVVVEPRAAASENLIVSFP